MRKLQSMTTFAPLPRWTLNAPDRPSECRSELEMQAKLVRWFYESFPEYRICTFSRKKTHFMKTLLMHNLGNPRNAIEGSRLNAAGLVGGRPDLSLKVARMGYNGLEIELKKPGEKPRPDQFEVMAAIRGQGYAVEWVDNLEDAKALILAYLNGNY